MLNKLYLLSLTAIALQTLSFDANAATSDRKSYPGSYCVEYGDTTSEAWYDSVARLRNDATGSNTFVCGAMLDHGAAKDIAVSVYDANLFSGQSVSCLALTRSQSGGTGYYTQTVSSQNGTTTLNLGSLSYKPSKGYHLIRCSVPGKYNGNRSGINSYYIREYD
ncbi:hypothetical protein [Pleionea sp. CnH1-48]|uniref:hypothetical protein n=1 Tax=Pleionea sp. CnH1-48 TaxID=2954494 RepID=UPI0020980F88|nr:hypothetical protein [Pleionea sp. CnH1-48]MCO7223167.1 hypothetical protein [Pleionea sp. CnH1-48]